MLSGFHAPLGFGFLASTSVPWDIFQAPPFSFSIAWLVRGFLGEPGGARGETLQAKHAQLLSLEVGMARVEAKVPLPPTLLDRGGLNVHPEGSRAIPADEGTPGVCVGVL